MHPLFLTVILVVFSSCNGNLCEHPFQETPGGKCLFNPKDVLRGTWEEGQRICSWLNEKSRLLEIRSYEELQDVTNYLLENDGDCALWTFGGGPWIGAAELGNTNQFTWSSDNSTLVVSNWVQGQPNSPTTGDAVMMSCEFSFQWMDKAQDTQLPVLCESTPRGKCPEQFTAVGDTCYYIGDTAASWDLAQEFCSVLAPNGKLIELETLDEIYLVTEFLNNNSDPTRNYWTGAEERERHDEFYWASSGKPVVITNWFSDYAPDTDTDDAVELARGIPYGWRWNAYPKSTSSLFYELCEADPADL